ncbi:MAG: extracellular repeat protein family, partial [Phycisphaerales bacterium]|nr:extracellular repeat protein family [Phycisphaerales bacterium]
DTSTAARVTFAAAAGTGKAGRDFLPRRGTLAFRPGVTTMRVTVPVKGDAKAEPDETLYLDLTDAVGATVDTARGTGTITNDDTKGGGHGGGAGGGSTSAGKVAVDFTTAAAGAAKGYLADTGEAFGARAGGQSFGWAADNAAAAVDAAAAGHNAALRTYNVLGAAAGAWEFALPNGRYKVRLSAGDPDHPGETYAVTAEGAAFLAGTTTAKHRVVEAKGVVEVTDGRLTLAAGGGSLDKLASIKIRAL